MKTLNDPMTRRGFIGWMTAASAAMLCPPQLRELACCQIDTSGFETKEVFVKNTLGQAWQSVKVWIIDNPIDYVSVATSPFGPFVSAPTHDPLVIGDMQPGDVRTLIVRRRVPVNRDGLPACDPAIRAEGDVLSPLRDAKAINEALSLKK